jgi:hypothetical protein
VKKDICKSKEVNNTNSTFMSDDKVLNEFLNKSFRDAYINKNKKIIVKITQIKINLAKLNELKQTVENG